MCYSYEPNSYSLLVGFSAFFVGFSAFEYKPIFQQFKLSFLEFFSFLVSKSIAKDVHDVFFLQISGYSRLQIFFGVAKFVQVVLLSSMKFLKCCRLYHFGFLVVSENDKNGCYYIGTFYFLHVVKLHLFIIMAVFSKFSVSGGVLLLLLGPDSHILKV